MGRKEEKPEYLQTIEVVQGPDGYVEVFKNGIGFADGQWEPTLQTDPVVLLVRQKNYSIIDTGGV